MNYVLNEEKMFADVTDGIAIIINSETGIYYGLNGLGTAVYENLMNGSSVAEVLLALKSISGVPADIEAKLNEFISKLDRKSTRLNSSHTDSSRMPSSA